MPSDKPTPNALTQFLRRLVRGLHDLRKPFKRFERPLLIVAACLLAIVPIYILVINLFLISPLAGKVINMRQEMVYITFDRCWSVWPGRMHARNVYIRVDDGNVQLQVTADEAQMDVNPLTLFSSRVFTGSHVRGHGISLRLRQYLTTQKDATKAKLQALPPIDGFPATPPVLAMQVLTDAYIDNLIGVHLSDMDVTAIRELWIDEYRFVGRVNVKGEMYIKRLRAAFVSNLVADIRAGSLSLGEAIFAERIVGSLSATLNEIDLASPKMEDLRGLDCALDLQAGINEISFLNYYLKRLPQVRLAGGQGNVALTVSIEKGRMRGGSRLTFDSKRLQVALPLFTAVGTGRINWHADEQGSELSVEVAPFAFVQQADNKTYMRGKKLLLQASTSKLDLAEPIDLKLKIALPDMHADDLTFINRFIPTGSHLSILNGSGAVHGHFSLSSADQRASGELHVNTDRLSVRNKDAVLSGKIEVRALLVSLNLETNQTDLSGSTVKLSDVSSVGKLKRTDHFWANVSADSLTIHPNKPTILRTKISVALKNLSPVIDVIAAHLPIPGIVGLLLNIENVKLSTELEYGPKLTTFKHMQVDGEPLHVMGHLALSDVFNGNQPARQEANARFLLQYGLIFVGITVVNDRSKVELGRNKEWYAQTLN